jgi:hypothetical protein
VFGDVGERLVDDPVDGDLDRGRERRQGIWASTEKAGAASPGRSPASVGKNPPAP